MARSKTIHNALARAHGCRSVDDGDVAIACAYCGVTATVRWRPGFYDPHYGYRRPRALAGLEVDHIVPVIRGGSNHASNLTYACARCNNRKGTMTADEFLRTRTAA